ncbi:extracellular solute-binding protein [Rhizobium sp. FY34]|uniref:ABC transporter substrate-binding protein n=1 Tax=Rhizobium sp. FY34 TaxID=2562309 RepID=UPI0010BFF6FB|nr:extracellular solute-binding protein [Rhizobium sp. FY34]
MKFAINAAWLAGAVGLALWSLPAYAANDQLIAAAKAEGKVVWYTTMIVDQAVRPIVAAFEAAYPGIKVEFARGNSGDTALKVINEGQAGNRLGDVFDGTGTYASVKAAGMVAPYVPDSAANLAAEFKDPDGYWHAANIYYLTAAYNTDLVSAEDAPKTYEDLLDPKWKGQMAWAVTPEPTGAAGFVGNVLMSMGEEKGMAYLKKLAGQKITNMSSSQRTVLDRTILGESPIALMIFNHHVPISKEKGAPVEWMRMEPLVSSASLIGLVKNAPHPNAGKLLIDFILSNPGQQVIANASYLPSNPNVNVQYPELLPTGPKPFKANFMSPDVVEKNLAEWIDIVNTIFM